MMSSSDALQPGDIVDDYRIERTIGFGGMGTVYAAVHHVIDKRVAIKVLRRDLCADPEAVARFVQEARAVNRIGHRNIVDVFGFGVTDDGRSYLIMELLTGETLSDRIARGGIAVAEVCDLLVPITHALEGAHACGIVHRDLKPDNVFLAATGDDVIVKLLDFGIAKLLVGAGPIRQTLPGTTVGTPAYIAPEQARGRAVDGSADVYALGVIAFELLTGQLPFDADNGFDVMVQHDTSPPPVPSALVPLPKEADVLVREMLDKTASQRPSLARVRERLDELRKAARRPRVTHEAAAPHRRSRARWAVASVVTVAALVWGIGATMSRGDDGRAGRAMPQVPGIAAAKAPASATPQPVIVRAPTIAPIDPPPARVEPVERKPVRRQPTATVHHPAAPHPSSAATPAPSPVAPAPPPAHAPAPAPAVDDDDALASPFRH